MALQFTVKKIAPNILIFSTLIIGAIAIDYLLHTFNMAYVGRYFGLIGTLMIIISFLYSLKKRKKINFGSAKILLKYHEVLGWVGALIIIIHGGIHFNAIVPWVAVFSMIVVVASGLTGKYLLKDAKESLNNKRDELKKAGKTEEEIDREILTLALMVKKMQQWRKIHMPLTMVFLVFALIHIVSILLFWRW